jgi:hypothetical protein
MAPQIGARGTFSEIGFGLFWPGLIAFVFFLMVPDPPKNVTVLMWAVVQVWIYQLFFTVVGFVALWLVWLFLVARVGFPSRRAAQLFFWTSLVVSPLALIYFVLSPYW